MFNYYATLNNDPRRHTVQMYASAAAKLAFMSLLTSNLFGFSLVIHSNVIMTLYYKL